jgi:hypothetical protein
MTLPTLTAPPTAPDRTDPTTFATRADAFVGWWSTAVTEQTAFGAAVVAQAIATNYNATSTTSTLIGTGSKSMTWSTGSLLQVGQPVRVASTASPANYMDGQVTAYNSTTGAATVNVASVGGSGTLAAWTISLSAASGALMSTGDQTMSGSLGIGSLISAADLSVTKNITGATTSWGARLTSVVQSDVTSQATGYSSGMGSAAAAFTLGDFAHFRAEQGTLGAGSTITHQYGFAVQNNLTGGTNNYGFYSNLAAGSGRWAFFGNGTAQSYFGGNVSFNASLLDASSGNDVGGYKGSPINAQNGNYTLALTDKGKTIYSENVGAQTITIPTNAAVAFAINDTMISIFNNGTTAITISTTGITIYQAGTANTGNRTLAAKGYCTVQKLKTDTWVILGTGLS